MLKLMYITNNPKIAKVAENAGVDRVFVDMEYIGKELRQGGMDTVQSHHTIEDIRNVREHISKAELLVRCNPIHEATADYDSSENEINKIIQSGADVIMLPYFKSAKEVERFIRIVEGRTKTMLLVETPEAVEKIDSILEIPGIEEIHIGLNDLSLGYGKKFMFELLADGTVERLCAKFQNRGIQYGFGGIASLGKGELPAEYVIKEHYRLKSSYAILSRSFCDVRKIDGICEIEKIFNREIQAIREYEKDCEKSINTYNQNYIEILNKVASIVASK